MWLQLLRVIFGPRSIHAKLEKSLHAIKVITVRIIQSHPYMLDLSSLSKINRRQIKHRVPNEFVAHPAPIKHSDGDRCFLGFKGRLWKGKIKGVRLWHNYHVSSYWLYSQLTRFFSSKKRCSFQMIGESWLTTTSSFALEYCFWPEISDSMIKLTVLSKQGKKNQKIVKQYLSKYSQYLHLLPWKKYPLHKPRSIFAIQTDSRLVF